MTPNRPKVQGVRIQANKFKNEREIIVRKTYEMTKPQLDALLEACKSVPVIIVGGVGPSSPQENANRAWEHLGLELNFDPQTVEAIPGKEMWWFTAEELPPPKPKLPEPIEALKDLLFQLHGSKWEDEHGHPIEKNAKYLTACEVVGVEP